MKHVTQSDIAAHLDISKFSVSRALSGKNGVSEKTRREILKAATDLGYEHPATYNWSTAASGNIMIVIPQQDMNDGEFWLEVISGAEEEAQSLGYSLITRPFGRESQASTELPRHLKGTIIAGSEARAALQSHLKAKCPATLITYPKPLEPLDSITIGDREGGYVAGEHLIHLSHTHLAFISDRSQRPSSRERLRGIREVALKHRIRLDEFNLDPKNPGLSLEQQYAGAIRQNDRPTGLFCSTDGVAFATIWTLGRLGLNVPKDASVIGFNDTLQAEQFVPRLTTLRVPKRAIGVAAVQSLHKQIQGQADGVAMRLSLLPTFIERDSTGKAPQKPSQSEPTH